MVDGGTNFHLQRRQLERKISDAEIREAIDNAETVYPSQDHPDRQVILGVTAGGRRLKVVRSLVDGAIITVAERDDDN